VGEVAGVPSAAEPGLRTYVIPTRDPAVVQPAIDALRAAGITLTRVERARETLEDLFVRSVVDERGRAMPGAARGPGTPTAPPIIAPSSTPSTSNSSTEARP
jgi:hypothetical protein